MRFYALVLWRLRGVVPSVLQLVYLGNGEILRYEPDEDDLRATERKVEAVWRAIRLAQETRRLAPEPVPPLRLVLLPPVLPDQGRHDPSAARGHPGRCDGRVDRRVRRLSLGSSAGTRAGACDAVPSRRQRRRQQPAQRLRVEPGERCRRRPGRSPSRIGTWLGTHSTVHPAATADLAPVLESSIARHCPGCEAQLGGRGEVRLGVRLAELDAVPGHDAREGARAAAGPGSGRRTAATTSSRARRGCRGRGGRSGAHGRRAATARRSSTRATTPSRSSSTICCGVRSMPMCTRM